MPPKKGRRRRTKEEDSDEEEIVPLRKGSKKKDEDYVTISDECVKLETGDIVCGKTFNSFDEAVNSMRKWCDKTFTPFILKVSRGNLSSGGEELGRISYICTHRNKHKSKATSQRVNYTACPSRVNINQQRNVGEWKIMTAQFHHDGHLLGEDVYGTYKHVKKLSEEDQTYAQEFIKNPKILPET